MQGSTKIPITDLNVHITCKICNGYFVDATTIIECLHTFCRSCIVKYLEKNKYCPVCDVQVHKTKPLLNIRPDKTIQDLVYKLVPRLFQNEMQKRRAFYDSHPESKPSSLEQCGEAAYQHLLTPEETICLTLTYHGSEDRPRYLRCPAAVSMAHLKKLICAKYDLSDNHRVDILYNQDCLNPSLTLMDVAYIYLWKRKEPMELTYRIYERTSKRPRLEMECVETSHMNNNNNNWKEVQLRISENGEMSITGIQEGTLSPLLEIVNSEPKYKSDMTAEELKLPNKSVVKKELPALKYIGKGNSSTVCTVTSGQCTLASTQCTVTSTECTLTSTQCTLASTQSIMVSTQCTMTSAQGTIASSQCATAPVQCTTAPVQCTTASAQCTTASTVATIVTSISLTTKSLPSKLKIDYNSITLVPPNTSNAISSYSSAVSESTNSVDVSISSPSGVGATLSSATTTTVYSTINSSKCSTKSEEVITSALPQDLNFVRANVENRAKSSIPPVSNDGTCDKILKRKNTTASDTEPPAKLPKQTILNHSLGLHNLSNNHPLKKHSKLNRNGENVKDTASIATVSSENDPAYLTLTATSTSPTKRSGSVSATSEPTVSKASSFNKSVPIVQTQLNRHEAHAKTPAITVKSTTVPLKTPAASYEGVKPPCYMPKSNYSPIINVPKPVTSKNHSNKPEARPPQEVSASSSFSTLKTESAKLTNTSCSQPPQQINVQNSNNKLCIKTKPSSPIVYKTLRDPPKSWNSQISKANLTKSSPEPKYSDLKNVRPAKFFKMRNNMPRYLGNPASGVKPMYQLHVSPEKEKNKESSKTEKSEIKKHSIVKIDPKTLRPISEKAPETTSLSNHSSSNQNLSNHSLSNQNFSNQSLNSHSTNMNLSLQNDLKINTSSVSIFSPLKLQSSPKNDRKSPKSPHSPKPKANSSPTGNKREKMNLNFTPSNPFIPNLSSTTLSPNQFLYPTGPPGFPPYDPRVMAAYHNLWYGQRMPFPTAPMPGLSLDLNQQRKNLEMLSSPTSPKMGALSQPLQHQISSRPVTTTSNISSIPRTHNLLPSLVTYKPPSSSKKSLKDSKSEKSIENAVEKLTQNRHRAIGAKNEILTSADAKNSGVEQKEKRVSKPREYVKISKNSEGSAQENGGPAKETAYKVKIDTVSPTSGCSMLSPSEIRLPPIQSPKSDPGTKSYPDKPNTNPTDKILSDSFPDNNVSSSKNDQSKEVNKDEATVAIPKTLPVKQDERSSENSSSEIQHSISTSSKKSHGASGTEQTSVDARQSDKSDKQPGEVSKTSDASCGVQDNSVSVNTTPCMVKVGEGITGSNFMKSVKNNDNNQSKDIIIEGNGLC